MGITTGWTDPDFRLFRGNTLLTTPFSEHNADWDAPTGVFKVSQAPELRRAFSYVGAFPLPEKSKDAADIVSLYAGSYTVTCATANDDDPGGEVLVEVYFLP